MNLTAVLLLLLFTVIFHLPPACVTPMYKSVWQFGKVIKCVQPDVDPLEYNDYGCYCGFGGTGTPQDELDKCCQIHDNCYGASTNISGCSVISELPYIARYDYTCENQQVTCLATNDTCHDAVCECDRAAAHCFAQATFNSTNKNLDTKVHCVD